MWRKKSAASCATTLKLNSSDEIPCVVGRTNKTKNGMKNNKYTNRINSNSRVSFTDWVKMHDPRTVEVRVESVRLPSGDAEREVEVPIVDTCDCPRCGRPQAIAVGSNERECPECQLRWVTRSSHPVSVFERRVGRLALCNGHYVPMAAPIFRWHMAQALGAIKRMGMEIPEKHNHAGCNQDLQF